MVFDLVFFLYLFALLGMPPGLAFYSLFFIIVRLVIGARFNCFGRIANHTSTRVSVLWDPATLWPGCDVDKLENFGVLQCQQVSLRQPVHR